MRSQKKLKTITQRYLSYRHKEERIRLPLIMIRLVGPKDTFKTSALIDSGATVTFVETEIAEVLGLPQEKQDKATGAGGEFDNWVSSVDIQLLKGTTVACVMEDVSVYVPKEIGRIPYCVLGRDSIFEFYNITFKEREQRTILRQAKRSH